MERGQTCKLSVRDKDYNPQNNFQFQIKEINRSELGDLVKHYNYSLIIWKNNIRKKENFLSACGCTVDIDNGLTLEKAAERLKKRGLNAFMVSSKRHTKEKNRYHILVFFSHPVYCASTYEIIIQDVFKLFPEADSSVMDTARFIFGSPDDCEIHENRNGDAFDVSGYKGLWDRDTILKDKDDNTVILHEGMAKTPIVCPFHDDENPSAFVAYKGNFFIHCSSCDKTFWMLENQGERLNRLCRDFYSYGTDIWQFSVVSDEFAFNKIGTRKFHVMTKTEKEKDDTYTYLVQNKHIRHLHRIDYISDMDTDRSFYDVNLESGVISVHHNAVPVMLDDNNFIETYLEDRFREHTNFIKEWLAVYCYTNYRKLPTLIFSGPRGNGKSSFAEVIAEIFPGLSYQWAGSEDSFTYEAEKKFLIVEENQSDKISQYKTLKKYSGSRNIDVRKKFKDPYLVKNNMNICILSNDVIPLFVISEELPADSKNNQFFVYEFPPLSGAIDPTIQEKLVNRLGHYIRTELKTVYDGLNIDGYRYSIDVPITEWEKELFANNTTENEHEAQALLGELEDMYHGTRFMTDSYATFIKQGYIPGNWLKDSVPYKSHALVKTLIRKKWISSRMERVQIDSHRYYCYPITVKLLNELKSSVKNITEPKDDGNQATLFGDNELSG